MRRWVLPAVTALGGVLLALSTNVATSLVPGDWTTRHATWVWVATGILAVLTIVFAAVAARTGPETPPAADVITTGERSQVTHVQNVRAKGDITVSPEQRNS